MAAEGWDSVGRERKRASMVVAKRVAIRGVMDGHIDPPMRD